MFRLFWCIAILLGGCAGRVALPLFDGRASVVRSIDVEDVDFDDLVGVKKFVGDARVVMLGEHHVDGKSFLAMARLVRFLHERMGFDVLAFESGLVDMEAVDRAFVSAVPVADAVELGVASPWSQSLEARSVFEYVAKTKRSNRPMSLAGFDIVRTLGRKDGSGAEWRRVVLEGLGRLGIVVSDSERQCLEETTAARAHTRKLCVVALAVRLEAEVESSNRGTEVERGFMRQILRSLSAERRTEAERADAPDLKSDPEGYVRFMNEVGPRCVRIRDEAMGDNLRWLVEKRHPKKKVIVWAAEGHTNRVSQEDGVPSAGHAVVELLGAGVRALTFVWYSGAVGVYGGSKSVSSSPDSFEALVHRLGRPYVFVDIRDLPGPAAQVVGEWYGNQDGLFFLDEMSPNSLAPDGSRARDALRLSPSAN